jgi:hypothetical protein
MLNEEDAVGVIENDRPHGDDNRAVCESQGPLGPVAVPVGVKGRGERLLRRYCRGIG